MPSLRLDPWQVTHQVPRCWPHSTTCRSPGHGILGRPGLMVISPENVQHRRWFVILDLFLRTRTGKSSMSYCGGWWWIRHPIWRTELGVSTTTHRSRSWSSLHYYWCLPIYLWPLSSRFYFIFGKSDIKGAFRLIPMHPSDHRLMGFMW